MQSDPSQTSQWTAVNVNSPLPKRQTELTLETAMPLNCSILCSSNKKKNMFFIFLWQISLCLFLQTRNKQNIHNFLHNHRDGMSALSGLDSLSGRNKLFTFSLTDKTLLGVEFTVQYTTLVKLLLACINILHNQILTGSFLTLKKPCRKNTLFREACGNLFGPWPDCRAVVLSTSSCGLSSSLMCCLWIRPAALALESVSMDERSDTYCLSLWELCCISPHSIKYILKLFIMCSN